MPYMLFSIPFCKQVRTKSILKMIVGHENPTYRDNKMQKGGVEKHPKYIYIADKGDAFQHLPYLLYTFIVYSVLLVHQITHFIHSGCFPGQELRCLNCTLCKDCL